LRAADVSLEDAIAVCARLQPPPGRMQTLGGEGQPLVVVDYAHTPDALEKVLSTLREISSSRGGKLHCLFGCGGDRDSGKRPMMGAVAERCADHVVLTSDNPRSEEPMHILEEIRDGMQHLPDIEADRAQAIRQLIGTADSSDVILLAGKGHEEYQETQGVRRPFSDLHEAEQALRERPC
jgi:UDP-N-acetylmuramoyl-L-alanyl-D-glutamate--2,6-diaminopimelate ligase